MTDDSLLPFSLPPVGPKKITAALDGSRISSDGGVILLGLAEWRLGIADWLPGATQRGLYMRCPTSCAPTSRLRGIDALPMTMARSASPPATTG
jgi:hypothetical protein